MRFVLMALSGSITVALLAVAGVRGSALLSDGAELDLWTIGCGVLGLAALAGTLTVGPTLRRRTLPR